MDCAIDVAYRGESTVVKCAKGNIFWQFGNLTISGTREDIIDLLSDLVYKTSRSLNTDLVTRLAHETGYGLKED